MPESQSGGQVYQGEHSLYIDLCQVRQFYLPSFHTSFDYNGGFDMTSFMKALRNEKGQGLTEYALIIALVAIVAVAALTLLGGQINTIFGNITDQLSG